MMKFLASLEVLIEFLKSKQGNHCCFTQEKH